MRILAFILFIFSSFSVYSQEKLTYPLVDTGQTVCYGLNGEEYKSGKLESLKGQDADTTGNIPSYKDNGDGTVSDLITGLMWQQDPGEKMTYENALKGVSTFRLGGYDDWRLPTIKELYSLILFSGKTGRSAEDSIPYIDSVFHFRYGDTFAGERFIDSQFATSTLYTSTTMGKNRTMFGVNFADGRIKGYPVDRTPRGIKEYYVIYVRGNIDYGKNRFVDNHDGTISDLATGLMWMKDDSGKCMAWEQSLEYADQLKYAGYDNWRIPNAKELQSIVDYNRSPEYTHSPAIDPVFKCSEIVDEGGEKNYPFYWTSTSHLDGRYPGSAAVYVAFGEALGFMKTPFSSEKKLMDVHGAGAQRSDPKTGSVDDFPYGHGPQGDVRRIYNYVRCVRNL